MSEKPTYEELEQKIRALEGYEEQLILANQKLETLHSITSIKGADIETISNHVLNSICKMTESRYGFYGYLDDDASDMIIYAWTDAALKDCSVKDRPKHFPVKKAGVWAEAIRNQKAYILNDYDSYQGKKGAPDGHVKINNLLVLPILKNGTVISVAAVANKPSKYDQDDINQLETFLFSIQALIESKQAEEKAREGEKLLANFVSNLPGTAYQFAIDENGTFRFEYIGENCADLFGISANEILDDANLVFDLIPQPDADKVNEAIMRSAKSMTPYNIEHRVIKRNGETVWIHASSIPRNQDNGSIIWDGIGLNITERKQIEEELNIERFKLEEYFENLPMLAYNVSFDGIIEDINNVAVRTLGYTDKTELIGKPLIPTIYAPASQDKAKKLVEKWKDKKAIKNEELQIITKQGETIDILLNVDTIFDHYGTPMHSLSTQLDISDRKQDRDKLRLSEERYRLLFESADVLVSVYDRNGICQLMNRKLAGLFGGVSGDYVKKSFEELHPGKGVEYSRRIREVVDSGVSKDYEDEVEFPEGHRWLLSQVHPVKDAKGNITAAQIISQDITERKLFENSLKESERKYRDLVDTLPYGIEDIDLTGRRTFINKAYHRMLGYNYDEIVGTYIWDNDPTEESVTKVKEYFDYIKREKPLPEPYISKNLRKDGTVIDVNIDWNYKYDEKGELKGFFAVVTDVTGRNKAEEEKRRLQAQLLHAQKMESIGNLAGGIAHDFNNILSSIIGFTELALDDARKGSILEDSLQEVYSAGKRAKDLVKQILAFARQSEEKIGPVQPSVVAKEVLRFIRSTIPTTIEIQQEIESESLIMGNATQVHQVLMNLCTNAAYAMEDSGGILSVSIEDVVLDQELGEGMRPGDYVEIKVSDTGAGIAPEIIDSIFEPYFTTRGVGEGTGLGLAMAQGVIESYGGKIDVDSQLGQGTTFAIYLPATQKREDSQKYVPEELPKGTERILFVDDEAPIAKMYSQLLERLGYSVTTRTSSVEALKLFEAEPNDFDLVITDMTMPKLTGDKFAIELMKIRRDIPVILCTGYSKKISDETASQIGIKAFAYKPMVKADLAKTVREVLDETKS